MFFLYKLRWSLFCVDTFFNVTCLFITCKLYIIDIVKESQQVFRVIQPKKMGLVGPNFYIPANRFMDPSSGFSRTGGSIGGCST